MTRTFLVRARPEDANYASDTEAVVVLTDEAVASIKLRAEAFHKLRDEFSELYELRFWDSTPDYVDHEHEREEGAVPPTLPADAVNESVDEGEDEPWDNDNELYLDITKIEIPDFPQMSENYGIMLINGTGVRWEMRERHSDRTYVTEEIPYSVVFEEGT